MHLLYLQDLNGKPLQILISEDQFKLLRVLSYADMSSTVFSATTNWSHKAEGAIGSLDWDFPNPVDHWFKQRLCGMRSSGQRNGEENRMQILVSFHQLQTSSKICVAAPD